MDSKLTTFVALDGDNIAVQDWSPAEGVRQRGVVLLVHGLGEHAGRYDALACQLSDWGFSVRGYDQHGHGQSGGVRGSLPTDTRLLDDLADMVDSTRARMALDLPLILLGHSLGGLVAARFVQLALRPIDALVLSSPALDPGLNAWQKLMLAVLPPIAPNLRVGNGVNAALLSHDPAVVAAYQADRDVHDRISGRLARFIADTGPAVLAAAPSWFMPTLLLYGGADQVVNPAGSRAFAAAAPKQMVTTRCFEPMYHEVFNELQRTAVYAELKKWLDARF